MKKESLVELAKQNILEAIGTGKYLPGNKMMPVRKLSEELNVSHVTAASAVRELVKEGILTSRNGSGTYISGKLPFRLLHSRANTIRRPLYFFFRNMHSESSYHSAILCTLQNECAKRNWEICANILSKENLLGAAADSNAAGIVFAPMLWEYPAFKAPVINYDLSDNGQRIFPVVMPDYFMAGFNAGLYLLKKNIPSPCFVSAAPPASEADITDVHFQTIYNGLNHAYRKHGLPDLPIYHWAVNHPCRKEVESLLNEKRKQRLVLVVGNRSMASEIYISLTSKGLRVPEDVGLLTFIRRCAQDLKTPIDTFDFDQKQMATEILNLLDRANGGDPLPSKVLLPLNLYPEGSI